MRDGVGPKSAVAHSVRDAEAGGSNPLMPLFFKPRPSKPSRARSNIPLANNIPAYLCVRRVP